MKALVINLGSETTRWTFQAEQLTRLGLPFERLEAVIPQNLDPSPEDPYWQRWERPLRPAEMAALQSHRAAWRNVAAGREPKLILEDDALLLPGAAEFISQVAAISDIDHISLEDRGRKKLVSVQRDARAPMRRLWQDKSGAAAYILWPSGARKLLARIDDRPGLADAVICAAYDLSSWQADPALAFQLDQCVRHGIAAPIAVKSTIDSTQRPGLEGLGLGARLAFRSRRILAQVRMALRHLRHWQGAQRMLVPVAGIDVQQVARSTTAD